MGKRASLQLLDEVFNGGVVDSTNQPLLFLLMSLASAENVSQVKIGRVTQQSIAMMRHIKKFLHIEFKIEECDDEIFDSQSSESENEDKDDEEEKKEKQGEEEEEEEEEDGDSKMGGGNEKVQFPKTFIFSCMGIGLMNIARKAE